MNPDISSSRPSPNGTDPGSVRRRVVDMAAELMRGTSGATGGAPADSSGQPAMSLYLALLTDRLPVFANAMITLHDRIGEGDVEENLVPAARAATRFYGELLAAKVSVFTNPDQLLQVRRVMKAHAIGPRVAPERVAAYLEEERRLGRVGADVDCEACGWLLVGACMNYAYTAMLLDDVMPRDLYLHQVVRGLRLTG